MPAKGKKTKKRSEAQDIIERLFKLGVGLVEIAFRLSVDPNSVRRWHGKGVTPQGVHLKHLRELLVEKEQGKAGSNGGHAQAVPV